MSFFAGTYHLITTTPNSSIPGLRASLSIQLGKAGTFTAKLVLGNKRYRFKGDFLDPEGFGTWLKPLAKGLPTTVVHLVLSQVDGIPSITGTVDFSLPPGPLVIDGYRLAVHSKADPAPQAGKYTWGAPLPNNRPFGSSFGSARISANGAATFTGVLGDGTPFSAGSGVTDTGLLLIEVPLYGRKGSVNGVLQFRDVPGTSDFDGILNWSWPEDKTNPDSDLITDDLAVVGSRLAMLAPGANLLPGDTATFYLWGTPIGLLLRPNNKVVADSSPYALQVQLNAATHAFSGSYFIRDDVKRGRFRGRYLAKSRSTFGQLREVDGEIYYAPVTIVIP